MTEIRKYSYPISGMHCNSCAKLLTRGFSRIEGIKSASVNFANETAYIESDKDLGSEVEKLVNSLGYRLGTNIEEEKRKEITILKTKVISTSVLAATVMLPSMLLPYNLTIFYFTISLFVQIFLARDFYLSLWSDVRNLSFGMNSLVAIGTTAAFVGGYYETSVTIIALILLGRYLETRAKLRTGDALKKLIGLTSKLAKSLKPGDEVKVKPSQKIPTDGVVISGESYVDESAITGESAPVKKSVGDGVVGGTINKNGSFTFKVTKVGADTVLSQIIKLVADAQGSRAEVQNMVDKVSFYFVPAILILALVSFFTFGITSAIAVLVVACPCAMGLATPTAIVVSIGKGAKNGILIKDIGQLEVLNKVKLMVFDKTGTLTIGKMTITNNVSRKNLQIAASLEESSEHPIAEAIVNKAKEKNIKTLKVWGFKSLEGRGVEGIISGQKYFLGKSTKSDVGLILNGKLLAGFDISDPIKPGVGEMIKGLKNNGVETLMISGDNKRTAKLVAKKAGISKVIAEVMPADKADKIRELQNYEINGQKNKVAFVGDGINDAPALATADVGIAMGTGTDVAIESSGITLLNKDIKTILSVLNLSKLTMKIIRQNLFWAFGYNIILIPVAFAGYLNPMFAAGAMAASSISVVGNSLRLKVIKI